jgi:hypothetical protein
MPICLAKDVDPCGFLFWFLWRASFVSVSVSVVFDLRKSPGHNQLPVKKKTSCKAAPHVGLERLALPLQSERGLCW